MSVTSLIEEIRNHPTPERVNVGEIVKRIHEEFDAEPDSEQRGMLLAVYTLMMDAQEQVLTGEDLTLLRNSRKKEYNLFLIKESVVDNNVNPHLLKIATDREVKAGRMTEDHELRKLAVAGDMILTPKPREKLTAWGFVKSLFS